MGCMTVRSAEDMAWFLYAASPETAAAFARAEHEKACAGWDEGCTVFWHGVMKLLANPAALKPARPAPRRPAADPTARPTPRRRLPQGVVRLARH